MGVERGYFNREKKKGTKKGGEGKPTQIHGGITTFREGDKPVGVRISSQGTIQGTRI